MRSLIRRLAVAPAFWLAFSLVALALHVGWARNTHGANLERCGALCVVAAGALAARPLTRLGYEGLIVSGVDGGNDFPTPAELEAERQVRIDAFSVQILAPTVAVAGTLLWGYGDVLGHWLLALRAR